MEAEQIKALALSSGFKLEKQQDGSTDINPGVYEFAKALLASSMAFGDGYYDGFIDGAKHQEKHDLNTSSHHLTDAALIYSEAAEDKRGEVPARFSSMQQKTVAKVCTSILSASESLSVKDYDSEHNWIARCIADGRDRYLASSTTT